MGRSSKELVEGKRSGGGHFATNERPPNKRVEIPVRQKKDGSYEVGKAESYSSNSAVAKRKENAKQDRIDEIAAGTRKGINQMNEAERRQVPRKEGRVQRPILHLKKKLKGT